MSISKNIFPCISVIMPVYNVDRFLDRSINSLLGQTWENMEIILIDDGSTDQSGIICDKYGNKYHNIKVIHQKNSGVSSARNAGLKVANGEYIGFVDPDDFVTSDMYEFLYCTLKNSCAEIAECGLDHYYVGQVVPYQGKLFFDVVSSKIALVREIKYSMYTTWNKLFSAAYLKGVYYHEGYVNGEDRLFVVESFCNANKVAYNMQPKYHYCHRQNSAGTKTFTKADIKLLDVCNKIIMIFKIKVPAYIDVAVAQLIKAHVQLLNMIIIKGSDQIEYREKLLKGLREQWREIFFNRNLPIKMRIKCFLLMISPLIYKIIYDTWQYVRGTRRDSRKLFK